MILQLANLVVTVCNWANYKPESILSTFTCTATNSNYNLYGLRDSISKNNFIQAEKLEQLD